MNFFSKYAFVLDEDDSQKPTPEVDSQPDQSVDSSSPSTKIAQIFSHLLEDSPDPEPSDSADKINPEPQSSIKPSQNFKRNDIDDFFKHLVSDSDEEETPNKVNPQKESFEQRESLQKRSLVENNQQMTYESTQEQEEKSNDGENKSKVQEIESPVQEQDKRIEKVQSQENQKETNQNEQERQNEEKGQIQGNQEKIQEKEIYEENQENEEQIQDEIQVQAIQHQDQILEDKQIDSSNNIAVSDEIIFSENLQKQFKQFEEVDQLVDYFEQPVDLVEDYVPADPDDDAPQILDPDLEHLNQQAMDHKVLLEQKIKEIQAQIELTQAIDLQSKKELVYSIQCDDLLLQAMEFSQMDEIYQLKDKESTPSEEVDEIIQFFEEEEVLEEVPEVEQEQSEVPEVENELPEIEQQTPEVAEDFDLLEEDDSYLITPDEICRHLSYSDIFLIQNYKKPAIPEKQKVEPNTKKVLNIFNRVGQRLISKNIYSE